MVLKPIALNEDKTLKIYSSDECQNLLKTYKEFYAKVGYNCPWIGYFIMKDDQVVGSCGFKGEPKFGKVEIVYWTFKEFEGQGVASFACKELVSIAVKSSSRITILARTKTVKNAATRILEKNGFHYRGIATGRITGSTWQWALQGFN